MLGRTGIGQSVREIVRDMMGSREVAEKIQESVGADKRLAQVRYGTFAEDGAIKPQYTPQGMSPNLLPQRWSEYEGYTSGALWTNGSDNATDDGSIGNLFGRNVLLTKAGSSPSSATLPYLDSTWNKFGADGQTYIYSTNAIQYLGTSPTNYVGLKIEAASDASGTGATVVYETPDTTTDMWTLSGAQGASVRVYAKFLVPAGKAYLRIKHKVKTNTGTTVAWNYNMLELVSDYRSFPSKYAAPTPKSGELNVSQMQFGLSKNLMPYGFSTLATYYNPVLHADTLAEALSNSGTEGYIKASTIGDGFSFLTNANATFRKPMDTWLPTSAPSDERLQVGVTYIASCDVKNLITTSDVTLRIRVRMAPTAGDVAPMTNLTAAAFSDFTLPANSISTPTKVYFKFTVPSGYTYGPIVEFRGTRASGTSSGLFDEIRVENLMLERLPSGSSQSTPSPFSLPVPGYRDIARKQVEFMYSGHLSNLTNRNIASGADQIQPLSWDWRNRFGTSDYQANAFWSPSYGLYMFNVNVVASHVVGEVTRMRAYIGGDFNQPSGQVALAAVGGTFSFNMAATSIIQMDTADAAELHVVNNSASTRVIAEVHLYITKISEWT